MNSTEPAHWAASTTCPACGNRIADSVTCNDAWLPFADGDGIEWLEPVHYDHPGHQCHDCGVLHGGVHHWNCDAAECPRCGDPQLLCCGCDLLEPGDPRLEDA